MAPSRFLKSTARKLFALQKNRPLPVWTNVQPFVDSINNLCGSLNIPKLLEMRTARHDQPVVQLRTTTPRLIVEKHFNCKNGNNLFDPDRDEA